MSSETNGKTRGDMRGAMQSALVVLAIAVTSALRAEAGDGVLEINQTCAVQTGCFPGDSAGFPVQISVRGGYALTSNLTPPNSNTTSIAITAAGVDLDLNGFTIQGSNTFPGPGGSCSAPGTGIGVVGSANDVVVSNGHIRGMGSHGIDLGTGSAGCRVEGVSAVQNCGLGIRVPMSSVVNESIARQNGSHGLVGASGSRIVDSIADINGGAGIRSTVDSDGLTVAGCVANANGSYGIFAGARSLVRGCIAITNWVHGVAALGYSSVVENIANQNGSRGISVLGSLGSGDATTVGLNSAIMNAAEDLTGGAAIACNRTSLLVTTCP